MTVIEFMQMFCEQYNYRFVNDYSGRFMYGALCVGIIVPNICCMMQQMYQYAVQVGFELNLPEPCTDNMGLSYIVYWPSICM